MLLVLFYFIAIINIIKHYDNIFRDIFFLNNVIIIKSRYKIAIRQLWYSLNMPLVIQLK